MGSDRLVSRRIVNLALAIPGWILLSTAINSIYLSSYLVGVLSGVLVLVIIGAIADGRIASYLEGKPLPSSGFAILVLILFVLLLGAFQDIRYNELTVSGELYLPGVITLIRVAGSVILTLALAIELVRLMRSPA